MISRILIDTNVLLDYLMTREPFYESAKEVVLMCVNGKTKACIAAHSISNMFFILRKDYNVKERKEILSNLCSIFDIEGIDKAKLLAGLQNEDFTDFEDCLQMECAISYDVDRIITRNVKDFSSSSVPAVTPEDFLKEWESLEKGGN